MSAGQARQYHLCHLRHVDSNNWIIIDIALAVEPVTEGSNSTVVRVLAIAAGELRQEEVYTVRSEFMISN